MSLPLVVRLYVRRADIGSAKALKMGLAIALGLRDPVAGGSATEAGSIELLGFGLLAQRHRVLFKGLDPAAGTAFFVTWRRHVADAFGAGTALL
jgi:hypothetical protein